MKISTCCQVETELTEFGICPECQEHCDFVDYDSDDFEIYNNFNHEGGIKYENNK